MTATEAMFESPFPEADALRAAAENVSDRRTLADDGFWVSRKEMRMLDLALGRPDIGVAALSECTCEPEHVWPCALIPRCDEPGCEAETTCGFPSPTGYRRTCGRHYRDSLPTETPR